MSDDVVLGLVKEIEKRKKEIEKVENPTWKTNCAFSFTEGRKQDEINIKTVTDVKLLINMMGFLYNNETDYNTVVKKHNLENVPKFTWQGQSVKNWLEDLELRIQKVQISDKKKILEKLEAKASALISPELKAKLEIEAIKAELGL